MITIPEAIKRYKSPMYGAACTTDNFDEKLVENLPLSDADL